MDPKLQEREVSRLELLAITSVKGEREVTLTNYSGHEMCGTLTADDFSERQLLLHIPGYESGARVPLFEIVRFTLLPTLYRDSRTSRKKSIIH